MPQHYTQEEERETSLLSNAAGGNNAPPQTAATLNSCVEAQVETQPDTNLVVSATATEMETPEQRRRITRLRRKLSRRSFLPQMDAYWENPGPLSPDKFAAVLGGLRNPAPNAWREAMLCAWLLGHAPLTAEQQAEATRALGKVARNRHVTHGERILTHLRTAGLRTLPCAAIGAAAITLHVFIPPLTGKMIRIDSSLVLFMCSVVFAALLIPVFSLMVGLAGLLNIYRLSRVQTAAILALARLRSPEAVAPLARATLNVSPNIRSVAEEGLRQCLPQITPDHYARLDADTVPALCRLLHVKKERLFAHHDHTEQLVLDVLAALGKIGDGGAVRHVESVAEDGWTQAVRDAARQVLPVLRERQQQENEPRLLLRGSAPPQTGSHQLLRPALTPLITLPEHLVRPVNAPKIEDKRK